MIRRYEDGATFGGRPRDLRQSQATQRAVATALGVGPPSVSGYQSDRRVPPPSWMRDLATARDALLQDEPTPPDLLVRQNRRLTADIGLLARLGNPLAADRTQTRCGGILSRGAYGAVRILNDRALSARNGSYQAERFAVATQFGILVKVPVLLDRASTPNLQDDNARLYEWSDADDPGLSGEARPHGDTGEAAVR